MGEGDAPTVRGAGDVEAREEDLAPVRAGNWTFVRGDHDVFGEGGVVVLAMPGHTPGNTSVLVRLPDRSIVLTGDTHRDAAVGSLHRLVRVAAEEDAEVWVGHDPDDWACFGAPGRIV